MPDLRALATQAIGRDGPLWICSVCSWDEVYLPITYSHMQPTPARESGNPSSPPSLARTADEQIESIRQLSLRQFPDDERAQLEYRVGLLEMRIRELTHRFLRLEVR